MNFTVIWTPEAEQQLAAVWLAAADQSAVSRAAHAIERDLARNPDALGDSLFDTVRAVIRHPIGVEYEVIGEFAEVYIMTVWDVSMGPPDPTGN